MSFVFNSENEKKCTLDQAFRGVLEEEIVSIFLLCLLLKFCWLINKLRYQKTAFILRRDISTSFPFLSILPCES
jgi:hypothetical protein